MRINEEVKAKLESRMKELRNKKNNKILDKIKQAQEEKANEFRTIAEGIDKRLASIELRLSLLEDRLVEGIR